MYSPIEIFCASYIVCVVGAMYDIHVAGHGGFELNYENNPSPRLRSVYNTLLIERSRDERGRDDNGVHLGSARCTDYAHRAKPR